MSEYKIVNRVHPTPAFAQTIAEVEAAENEGLAIPKLKTEFHVPVPKVGDEMKVPFHAGETIKFVEMVEASRAPSDVMVEVMALYEKCREESLPINRKEFEDFKERVIRAFKDMCFDTRKFFDE
jgi:hypothetical protein